MSDNKAVEDWLVPGDQIYSYLEVCQEAVQDDDAFATFRHDKRYCVILEHVPRHTGPTFLDAAKAINESFVERHFKTFQENDKVGGASCVHYPFGTIAPSTLWYVFILTDLLRWVGSLEGLDVVEIGGGYGGLCRLAMAICKPRSYTLFDLGAPLLLASKYLSHYGLHDVVRFRRAGDFEGMGNVDVVISTFSLLELSPETQEAYFTNLVSRSQLGYVAYNLPQNTPLEVYLKSHGGFETVLETQPGICTKIMWRRLQSLEAANSA